MKMQVHLHTFHNLQLEFLHISDTVSKRGNPFFVNMKVNWTDY